MTSLRSLTFNNPLSTQRLSMVVFRNRTEDDEEGWAADITEEHPSGLV